MLGVSTMSILLGCVVLSQPRLQSFSIYVFFLQVHPDLAGHLNLVGPRGQVSLGTACCVVVYTDLWDLKDILPSLKDRPRMAGGGLEHMPFLLPHLGLQEDSLVPMRKCLFA